MDNLTHWILNWPTKNLLWRPLGIVLPCCYSTGEQPSTTVITASAWLAAFAVDSPKTSRPACEGKLLAGTGTAPPGASFIGATTGIKQTELVYASLAGTHWRSKFAEITLGYARVVVRLTVTVLLSVVCNLCLASWVDLAAKNGSRLNRFFCCCYVV